ncbi:MAG: RadC family protein [Clostridia bacterium]|nr:RadC family protein [Clostridia bacterium]
MSEINHHKEHRKRLKNRFLSEGLDNFEVHNVLELLLFFGIPQKDTNDLAHELLNKFGSLSGVFEAPYSELIKVKGIGDNAATLIQLISPLSRIYLEDKLSEKISFDSTRAVGKFLLAKYRFRKDEMFSMLCLDQNCRLIKWVPISSGTINVTAVNTRKVVEAVMNTSANAVVLAHNHPAGLAVPSADDINSTIAIRKLIEPLGVTLLDHIIIANEDYVSLLESDQYKFVFK